MRIELPAAAAALALACAPAASQEGHPGAEGPAPWSYAGPTGPAHWARLHSPVCGETRQSPVDLAAEGLGRGDAVAVRYRPWSGGSVQNNGHSVVVRPPLPGSSLSVGDSVFELVELHLHVPSEHTVRGRRFAGEAHLVHQAGGGRARAVLATLFVEGAENPDWAALLRALPGHPGERNGIDGEVDLVRLLGLADVGAEWIYDYPGSLTTPPCDQNVRWLVRAMPVTLSRAQIEALSSAMVRNARPVQPLNARSVTLHRGW